MRWLVELQERIDKVPAKYLILDEPIQTGEKILGQLPDDLLRLYGLHLQIEEEIAREVGEHALQHVRKTATPNICTEFANRMHWNATQHETVSRLFWTATRYHFNTLVANLAIRAHGNVVTFAGEPMEGVDADTAAEILKMTSCGGAVN